MENKLRKFFASNVALSLLIPMANAGIVGIRKPISGTGGSSGSVVVSNGGKVKDEKVVISEGTASVSCKQDPDSATYFPLDFFQHITRDGSSLSFEQRADNKILVKMPASLDVCGKFKPQLHQDEVTRNVTIMMSLDNGMTYSEYLKCLEEKEVLKEGKINHDEISGNKYSEYSYVLDYSFDKNKDVKQTVKLSYGYPKAYAGKDGYGSPFGIDKDIEMPGTLCMMAEKIQPEITYINKGQDVLIQEINQVCKTKDAQKIADARRSIGNADALTDIADKIKSEMDAAYLAAVKKDVSEISEKMRKIEDQVNKEKDTMDESTARKKAREYADLAKDLDGKFLNQAIYRLDGLMKQRNDLEEGEARDKVDEEIKKLNADIGSFSKRTPTSLANLYGLMEKHALTDQAKTIEDIRLKSFLYSKVYPGKTDSRGKAITFEEANQKQVQGLQKFEGTLNDWNDQYLVGQGNLYPIKKAEKERSMAVDKMNRRWQDYQKKEYENYNKYCAAGWTGSVKNPVQCQNFMSGVNQRRNVELKRRERDLKYIYGRDQKLNKMSKNYGDYQQRKMASEMESQDYEPYGSTYSSYDEEFETQFPGYSLGATGDIAYNPLMYNMGGAQYGQQMGQYGMNNPMMVNAQNPVMQGQYQMGAGGWPSL